MTHRIGYAGGCHDHGCIARSLHTALKRNCTCIQFYMVGEIAYSCPIIENEEKIRIKEQASISNSSFYIHSPLNLNLAAKESNRDVGYLRKELAQIEKLPAACVLHYGKMSREGSIEKLGESISKLSIPRSDFSYIRRQLLIENAAGQKNEMGCSWEDFRKLYETLDRSVVGICLDTQHAFGAGLCNFDGYESVCKLFDESDFIVKYGLGLVHLNDSKIDFKGHVDRHERIKQGKIWSSDDESLRALIKRCREEEIDIILETSNPVEDAILLGKAYDEEF